MLCVVHGQPRGKELILFHFTDDNKRVWAGLNVKPVGLQAPALTHFKLLSKGQLAQGKT